YTGDGGLATAAKTHYPAGMTIDMSGNIYFGDIDNHVVRKINAMGIISTVVGNGINGYSGDGGPATLAEINSPSAVAIDAGNNFYISDGVNSVVRKVTHVNTVGINQITENLNRLNIYPNPNSGNFTIETNSVSNQTMQVYDINGKLILSQNINGITTIDASNLSNGIYNVNIIDNASVSNKKMVIIK
ncbi:MAG TPA: T9SS type A sorting domain-containing protein, partial [Bacteroidia bacterium]|nr:T9SS type A sorting domain-containing protein [Bacteroidia bacterium]